MPVMLHLGSMAKKVLVVDDDAAFRGFIVDALTQAQMECKTLSSGKEALQVAPTYKPDVVLLDLMMPEMHGYQVCTALREDKSLANLRIVIMSAKGYEYDRKQAKAAGADHYLLKPFRLGELLAAIG